MFNKEKINALTNEVNDLNDKIKSLENDSDRRKLFFLREVAILSTESKETNKKIDAICKHLNITLEKESYIKKYIKVSFNLYGVFEECKESIDYRYVVKKNN